jgi:hypothetical protein
MINWPVEITESKYSRWYDQLIDKARNRLSIDGYTETHHVIPRSLGGDNTKQNLVKLTAREHYVAHALLWKMSFGPLHHSKMSYALRLMMFGSNNKHQQRNYKCHSRLYQSVRIEFSQDHSKNMTGENNSFYGKKHTEDSIRKALQTKKETGNYGNKFQPGHKMSDETIRKISIAKKGQTWDKIHSPEELLIRKQKRSEDTRIRNTGQVFSEERKRKISEKMKGRVAHNKGVKGVIKQSPDTVAKRLATIKARGVTTHNKVIKICENCGKEVKLNMYSRWHGDNCKSLSRNTDSLS